MSFLISKDTSLVNTTTTINHMPNETSVKETTKCLTLRDQSKFNDQHHVTDNDQKLLVPLLTSTLPLPSKTLDTLSLTNTTSSTCKNDDDDSRSRSMSDSWRLWESVSPLWSPGSWFDNADRFQSFTSRQKSLTSRIASRESRRLVKEYDSARTSTLQQHEQFKHSKWGEDEFCEFDLDTKDIDIDLSIADSIKVLPLSETVAQCVKSYSAFWERFSSSPSASSSHINQEEQKSSQLSPLIENYSEYSTNSDEEKPTQIPNVLKEALHHNVPSSSVGELAVPRAVQEAVDFMMMVSRSASLAIESFIGPSCPKRYSGSITFPRRASGEPLCPRRRSSTSINKSKEATDLDTKSVSTEVTSPNGPQLKNMIFEDSNSGDEVQCGVSETFAVCPRRAVTNACPRREKHSQRRRRTFTQSISESFTTACKSDKEL